MQTPFGYTTMHKNYAYFEVERAFYYAGIGVDVICDADRECCYGIPEDDEYV